MKLKNIKTGDCFAYQIEDDKELKGRYFILCIKDRIKSESDYNYSFIYLKITSDNTLPKTEEEINALEDVIVSVTPMEARFFPFDARVPAEQTIKERSKVKVYPDEKGYLYTYTFQTLLTRKEYIKDMLYLGNFNVEYNKKEFLPFSILNYKLIPMKYFKEDIIEHYKNYNLKQSKLFSQTEEEREALCNRWNAISDACKMFDHINTPKKGKLKKGDCYAYQIKDDSKLKGRYFIACNRKIKDREYSKLYDYFNLKITSSNELPKNAKELESLEDVIVDVTPLEGRLLKRSFIDDTGYIAKEKKLKVYPDKMDYLYTYTFKILKQNNNILNGFNYLGNFNIKYPKEEYICSCPMELPLFIGAHFEKLAVSSYKQNNLKQNEIWHYTDKERDEIRKQWQEIVNDLKERK